MVARLVFCNVLRAAMAIEVKEQMDTSFIAQREQELVKRAFEGFSKIDGLHILADNVKDRLGIFSFWFQHIHFNLIVKLLNDRLWHTGAWRLFLRGNLWPFLIKCFTRGIQTNYYKDYEWRLV